MAFIVRGYLIALAVAVGAAFGGTVAGMSAALAETKAPAPELAPLAAWVGKGDQKATIEGKVARALGLNKDGKPVQLTAVTTAYLDGSRIVHLWNGPEGARLIFSQGKANQGSWFLANHAGAMLRAIQWVPTSANPGTMDAAKATPLFTETKAFWKNQLGKPVR